MNWNEWCDWKQRNYIAVVLFVIAYVITIPIRNYRFLDGFIDITQGVPLWAHLIIIIAGSIFIIIGLQVIEFIVRFMLRK